jgi:hypothetical protein
MFALVACVALALAGCIANAPPPPPQVGAINPVGVSSWWGNWEALCVLGLMISMFVVALAYMAGSLVRSNELLAWCKVEIYQIAMTALVLGGFIGMVWFIASIDTSIVGLNCELPTTAGLVSAPLPTTGIGSGTGCNAFDLSTSYLKWMRERTWIIYNRFLLIYNKYGFQTSITYGAAMGGIGPVLQPMVWLQPVLGYTTVIVNFIVTSLLLIMVQLEIMRYIQYGMLNIVLPIGIVCRCFSPLRDFGGALMGIAIALFLFYPLTFALNMAVVLPNPGDAAYVLDEVRVENLINDVAGGCAGRESLSCGNYADKTSCEAAGCRWDVANTIDDMNLQDLYDITAVSGQTDPHTGFEGFQNWWAKAGILMDAVAIGRLNFNTTHVILGALLLPLLDFVIITTAAREFSRFLGEEIDVSNLTRII